MARIVIPYTPRDVFKPFHNRTERFAIGVAHRRCGKTVACINDMVKRAVLSQKEMYRAAYIAPYLKQAKDVAWEYLKRYSASRSGGRLRMRASYSLLFWAVNVFVFMVRITLMLYVAAIWTTAFLTNMRTWRRAFGDRSSAHAGGSAGSATFIGTPKGRNAFHELYERAAGDADWFRFMLRASETELLPASELAAARQDMTPEQYDQEFECSFDAAIMGAYYGKDVAELERKGRIGEVEPINGPVHTAWDLGMGDSTAIWFWQAANNEIRIIDHYENHGQAIPHYVAEIEARGYPKGIDYVPHDAKVRSLETGRTRIETLISLGRKPMLVANHKIMDGINAARLTMPRIWIDAVKCKDGIEALRQYRADFDEKTRAFKDTPKHDWTSHTADAFRYLCMAWREQAKPDEKPDVPPVKAITDYKVEEMWKFDKRPRDRV
jgi:phage terminase large subunit